MQKRWSSTSAPFNERALVSSSSVKVVGVPFAPCAKTQMLFTAMMSSDHFQVFQEGNDLGVRLAVVFDDLSGLAGLCLRYRRNPLSRA
ncbi:MAG: hypothetical protein RLZZ332_896 [Actinomycetota bacterium]